MYLLYRTGLSYGVWGFMLAEESTAIFQRMLLEGDITIFQRRSTAARGIALALLSRFVKAVFSCLVAAFIITFNTWFFMQIHWDTEWVLAKGYFWHYLKDVFGACAAGGYVMSLPDGECVT